MDTTNDAIDTTIDRAGRIVIPKAIRDAARLHPGVRLRLSCHDGVIEIAPSPRPVRVEVRGRLAVAVPVENGPALSTDAVRETQERLRTSADR